ncbi:response regulator [Flagellimonas sp. DF-77]|uniref:response regulator n=1 Tax=Flagellimonas algarum TaxID=3230298 RepID=UPI003398F533
MSLKTVIIDDSSIQLLATSFLVQNHPKLGLIGAYSNPFEGIQAVYEQKADLLLLDVLIDETNAFELLDAIEIPCTILINSTWERYLDQAKAYGIDHFLMKPIRKQVFVETIDAIAETLRIPEMVV